MGGPIDEEVSVDLDGARLVAFSWQGQRYLVSLSQVVGTPPTRWWQGQGERTYFHVTTRGRMYEVYFDHERKMWVLASRLA